MTDPMLVRRLAIDLRNLADKTLELRGVVEDYRHDLVRTIEDDWCDQDELQALHRHIQELWESMDRAEALILLRDGLNAHLDPDTLPAEPRPEGRLAKRRAAYHAAIAACSDFRARLDAAPRPLLERAAETGSATPFPA